MMRMLVPETIDLRTIDVEGVQTVHYDPSQPIPTQHRAAEVLVVWGTPQPLLATTAATMPRLRWVQTLGAGPEAIVAAGFADEVLLTSGRTLHSLPVAEHALALLLAAARRLHELRDAQSERRWAAHLGGRQPLFDTTAFRSLIGAHVVIWGFGSIGQRLASYLLAMEARVTGIGRS
jgi:phosphoglycerate dehydrogenase-like enzyme